MPDAETEMIEPVLGLILPPADCPVPPEAARLYPELKFLAEGLAFRGITAESFDEAISRVVPAAIRLKDRGATAISIMGTSLTFYKGAEFNRLLIEQVHAATGLPATSMSSAIVEGLRLAGATRLAVATAYREDINAALRGFLEESGFEVLAIKGLNLIRATGAVSQERLLSFCREAFAEAPEAEALLISCGGLETLDLIVPLEAACRVPVISSTPHGLMNAIALTNVSPRVTGFGRILGVV
jgi:arylmalonate decarboxylase